MENINKTKSQTFQQITTQQDIKDILNQPNIALKERHDGLTVKFTNDNTNEVIDKRINDELNNLNTNEISQNLTRTKEVATQTAELIEKNTDNFTKFKYNSVTILEKKKISNIRKEIFYLETELKNEKVKNKNLFEKMKNINYIISEVKFWELYELENKLNKLNQEIKEKELKAENPSIDELEKLSSFKENIEEKKIEISKMRAENKVLSKEIDKTIFKIYELESNIYKTTNKLNTDSNELNIPATPPSSWIEKNDELAELRKKIQTITKQSQKEKILKKIIILNKEMMKIWDDKKVEKVYEEILPIEDKIFFITTFVHLNQSITENVIYFHNFKNGKIEVVNQIKKYENINEYKKDVSLIEDIYTNKNNLFFSKMNIKNFLKNQQNLKLKPTKIERTLWCIFTGATLLSITSTLLLLFPPIAAISAIAIVIKATAGIMGGTRIFASFFSSETRKVDAWFGNKVYKSKDQKEKTEHKSIIKNLTNDKLETKLQTQYDILKQELDNKKKKNPDQLINKNIINHNLNNISQNLNIKLENNQDFNSHLINDIHSVLENQPSTSTGIYHTSLLS